ncbi:MAG: aminodeoxychorismate synthase component I [Flavobacteriales bacterium]|tara:strand:+ start:2685 stop:3911 length:1227 start_codon:yes stop_codon:yes gene_type:complete
MEKFCYTTSDRLQLERRLLTYFKEMRNVVFLNSNNKDKINLFAVSNSNKVNVKEWKFGFITYDYKNQIEALSSKHFDGIKFPERHFFTPQILFKISQKEVEVLYDKVLLSYSEIERIVSEIDAVSVLESKLETVKVVSRITKEAYLKNVEILKQHIQLGDIYEVNFCQEYFAEDVAINPIDIYLALNKKSPTPFSCFVKNDDKYLMSATPERFIHKFGDKIISQPIKGTIKRGENENEDEELKKELFNDVKERSENVMIVDLVRNDLSKIANRGSVNVDELCGIYTFPQVHQMISTVSGKVKNNVSFDEIIKATFPMGSMTGAPKIKAMELVEQYEETKRGLYAGTVGYINPQGDFDFNVVIRSLQYKKNDKYLSFIVGGAITALSDPEKEYDECLLKAKAMLEVLGN